MSDEMDDDDGNGAGAEQIARVVNALMKALDSDTVNVKLLNGGTVAGSIAGLVIRKKEKKGEVTWNGKVSIVTEAGTLQLDCHNVASIA
jgi:translation initiation factor IF-1